MARGGGRTGKGGAEGRTDRLAWLLPVTYAAHAAEEFYAGFPRWLNRTVGGHLTNERFLELNGFFWLAMAVAVVVGVTVRPARTALVVMATIVLTNGLIHVGAAAVTRAYVPGLLTGGLIWLPLGAALLYRLQREVAPPLVVIGMGAGVLLHAMVSLAALK